MQFCLRCTCEARGYVLCVVQTPREPFPHHRLRHSHRGARRHQPQPRRRKQRLSAAIVLFPRWRCPQRGRNQRIFGVTVILVGLPRLRDQREARLGACGKGPRDWGEEPQGRCSHLRRAAGLTSLAQRFMYRFTEVHARDSTHKGPNWCFSAQLAPEAHQAQGTATCALRSKREA